MNLAISPYESIGPLRFGMNENEVVAVMGTPQRIIPSRNGNPVFWYSRLNVIMETNTLVEVGFAPSAPVSIFGVLPFADPGAFARLCELDGDPHEVLGFIVLRRFGISLTGFHDGDESQKAMTAFARGRWDVLEPEMRPFPNPDA